MNTKPLVAVLFCLMSTTLTLSAQSRETRNASGFSRVEFRLPGKLYIRQGATEKVEVEASKKMLSRIETKVDGSKLVIHTPMKFNWDDEDDDIKVYVTVKKLEGLSASGSGDIIGEGKFTMDDLDLRVSGSGSLRIEAAASGEVQANVSGSGELLVSGNCSSFESSVSGSGRVKLDMNVSGETEFKVSGSGRIDASGKSRSTDIHISGSGKVLAADLETKRCDVKISGSGDVEINVQDELDSHISGSGTVRYKGNPSKVNNNASGSGTVRKM